MEYGHEIWHLECKEFVKGRLPGHSFEAIIQILARFNESEGGQMGRQWHRTGRRKHIFPMKGE
jgi:hypothetical protein